MTQQLRLSLPILCLLAMTHLPARAQSPRGTGDSVPAGIKKIRATTVPITRPDTYAGRQIMVGSGGGFTGFSTTYYLLDNGQLFSRHSRDTTYQFLGSQSMRTTKRTFTTVETTCRIKKTRFDKPGNTYRFVRWKKGMQEYHVTWGAATATVPASYSRFYTTFMALIPASDQL